jgi:CHASE3 domain sensor protein
MTQLEIIEMIGDVLTDLDVLIGSLMPSDPNHQKLLDLRTLLDDRQRVLSRRAFDQNTAAFQQAAQQLQEINNQMQGTLQDIDHINDAIQNVTSFLNAATSLISTVALPALGATG